MKYPAAGYGVSKAGQNSTNLPGASSVVLTRGAMKTQVSRSLL
jgi:hypothetical protein